MYVNLRQTREEAISIMERNRTGNYGEDYFNNTVLPSCPVCGSNYYDKKYYSNYDDTCIGCSCCVEERSE